MSVYQQKNEVIWKHPTTPTTKKITCVHICCSLSPYPLEKSVLTHTDTVIWTSDVLQLLGSTNINFICMHHGQVV